MSDTLESVIIKDLIENLNLWAERYSGKPISLTLFRSSAILGELERRLAEAREQTAMWKANHDNQVSLKAMLMDRPDLGDRASRIAELIRERDEAREQNAKLREIAEMAITALALWAGSRTNSAPKLRAELERLKEDAK